MNLETGQHFALKTQGTWPLLQLQQFAYIFQKLHAFENYIGLVFMVFIVVVAKSVAQRVAHSVGQRVAPNVDSLAATTDQGPT